MSPNRHATAAPANGHAANPIEDRSGSYRRPTQCRLIISPRLPCHAVGHPPRLPPPISTSILKYFGGGIETGINTRGFRSRPGSEVISAGIWMLWMLRSPLSRAVEADGLRSSLLSARRKAAASRASTAIASSSVLVHHRGPTPPAPHRAATIDVRRRLQPGSSRRRPASTHLELSMPHSISTRPEEVRWQEPVDRHARLATPARLN